MRAIATRQARLNDLPTLVALERHFPSDRLSRENFRHLLTRAHADVLVSEVDGCLCANAVLLYRRGSPTARLYSLITDPAFRGRGIASRLLDACERAARRRGCREMSLEVRNGNRAARALYERRGYAVTRRIENFYTDGASALQLRKRLVR